jgi:TetR/AcrR family hemagglutinin/protease transcriptional regulator
MSRAMPQSASRKGRARPLPPRERKALLLRCAVKVFARCGIQGASYAEIAREARVSVPAVFVYFPTRARLVRAVLDEVVRFALEITQRIHDDVRPAPEIVFDHGRTLMEMLRTHPEYLRVQLEWGAAMRDEVWPMYLRFQDQLVGIMAATIRRWREETGSDPDKRVEDDARLLFSAGPMLAQMTFARVPRHKIEQFSETVVRDVFGDRALEYRPRPRPAPPIAAGG